MSLAKIIGVSEQTNWLRPSVAVLVLANLVPVFGVLFLSWEVFPLLLLFWLENVIVGVFNVLKMLLAGAGGFVGLAAKLFIIPFFCVHYGMFTMVHGMFVLAMFGGGMPGNGSPVDGLERVQQVIAEMHLGWAVLGLFVSHGFSFVANYLGRGEFQRANVQQLMMQPYGRVVVLHITILFGGFLMMALHSPNKLRNERIHLFEIEDTGETLRVIREFNGEATSE